MAVVSLHRCRGSAVVNRFPVLYLGIADTHVGLADGNLPSIVVAGLELAVLHGKRGGIVLSAHGDGDGDACHLLREEDERRGDVAAACGLYFRKVYGDRSCCSIVIGSGGSVEWIEGARHLQSAERVAERASEIHLRPFDEGQGNLTHAVGEGVVAGEADGRFVLAGGGSGGV